jgi:outer membrane biosynthesis protein TonB
MSPSRSQTRSRLSLSSRASTDGAVAGLIGALAIHAAIVAAMLFTWEHPLDITQDNTPVVPVDLVTLADKTNIMPVAPKIVAPEPVVQPEKLIVQPPTVATEQAEPAPSEQPSSQPVVKAPTLPVVTPRARPQARPDEKKAFNVDDVFKIVDKVAPQRNRSADTKADPQTRKGIGAQNANTMDLVDSLKNQIEQCWTPPAGAPHPEQLIVYVKLLLNPDGSVLGTPQLTAESNAAVAGNPFMRAAADAAQRAIYVCQPFKLLPANRYADWRESTIKFDPRDLAGQ